MKKLFPLLYICLFFGDSVCIFSPQYAIEIQDDTYEIGGKEDVMSRYEYLRLLTANPKTGFIPTNIHASEQEFGRKIQFKNSSLRTQQNPLQLQAVGPTNVGGRTRAVAFDIRDENIILAGGVSGGVWKSTDGGLSWSKKSHLENRNSITCIVQDIRVGKEDTWYHGTGELVGNSARARGAPFRGNGIYKSTDNGESWHPISSTQEDDLSQFKSQFQYIWAIEINPKNEEQDEVLVATYGGILRSIDGGDSWNAVLGDRLFDLGDSIDIRRIYTSSYTSLERSENGVFYATLSKQNTFLSTLDIPLPKSGFYFSKNGSDWTEITPFMPGAQHNRTVIGTSPSNPDVAYFMTDVDTVTMIGSEIKLTNTVVILEHQLNLINDSTKVKGFDPIPRHTPNDNEIDTQDSYNMTIRVHPENSNLIFVGAVNLYRSTDGLRTKKNITQIGGYNLDGGFSSYPNHHPDQHELVFLPSDPTSALSASDGGLIKTENINATMVAWQSRNEGFITSQFFSIAQSKIPNDPTMIGGMQDNGTDLTTDGSLSWQGIIGGDGGYAATTNDNALWLASFQNGQTLRLTFNNSFDISSFRRVDPAGLVAIANSNYLFINPFLLDPNNQNRMFCAGGNHLYIHPNISQIPGGSQTPTNIGWSKVNETPLQRGQISALDISLDSENVYYGTTDGNLFRLDNAANETQFNIVDITSNFFPKEANISSISVNPENNQHILVIFSNYTVISIFESTDGGESFENISGNLEENVDGSGSGPSIRWGEIIPLTDGNLYLVGTSIGVYSTKKLDETTTTWTKESPNLLGNAVVTMMDYRPSDGNLAIATHGNGIYTAQVQDFKQIETATQETSPFQVLAAYPNPFIGKTKIHYSIPENGEVRMDILSQNGKLIRTILWAFQYAGKNTVVWEGNNTTGYPVANGIYHYRIRYKNQTKTGKLILRN